MGLSFLGTTTSNQNIFFMDSGTPQGQITYDHTNDLLVLYGSGTEQVRMGASGFIFNELSADLNFRIESNGNANMFIVDGGNDAVALGTTSVDYIQFTQAGSFTSGGGSNYFAGYQYNSALTGVSGDSNAYGVNIGGSITTQGATETLTTVATVRMAEPDITVGAGDTVTNACSSLHPRPSHRRYK